MKYGLPISTIRSIHTVLSRYPQVERAILYGSRAKGSYKLGSDIDLTLRGRADLTLPVLYRIMEELDELPIPYTIDFSLYQNLGDPDVVAHIERAGVTFYEHATHKRSRNAHKSRVRKDHKPKSKTSAV